jgi:hypothetical protein
MAPRNMVLVDLTDGKICSSFTERLLFFFAALSG